MDLNTTVGSSLRLRQTEAAEAGGEVIHFNRSQQRAALARRPPRHSTRLVPLGTDPPAPACSRVSRAHSSHGTAPLLT